MRFAYRTNGLPKVGGGAFLPGYSQTPQGVSAGDLRTTGMMGTRPVASPRPAAMRDAYQYNQRSEGMDAPPGFSRPPGTGPFLNLAAESQPGYATGAFMPMKARMAGPDAIWPDGYISHVDGCYPPMPIYSDNRTPVPANDSGRFAATLMRAVRMGGVRVTSNPRPFPYWPTYGQILNLGTTGPPGTPVSPG